MFADYLPFIRGYAQQVPYARNFAVRPGSDFWFGSDQLGRDVFARCIYGARVSLLVAVSSIVIGLEVGGLLGIVAGYYRGRADRVTSILADCLLAFPPIVHRDPDRRSRSTRSPMTTSRSCGGNRRARGAS